jgi:hypothetical protein
MINIIDHVDGRRTELKNGRIEEWKNGRIHDLRC